MEPIENHIARPPEGDHRSYICNTLGCNNIAMEDEEYCLCCMQRHEQEDAERREYLEGK